MPVPNLDQVKVLAPDPASLKSGQELADRRHWSSLGGNQAALWGECKGSGKTPYKVRVDLANNGYACTCPSRKFPCKHVLGLMLLFAGSQAKLANAPPPAWVAEWLDKRTERSQAAAKRAVPKTGAKARQKEAARRAARREKLAGEGLDALERWLRDLVRLGLASAQSAPAAFWDEQAARMVDSQLPGAARLIREMAALPKTGPDWAEALLLRLGRLYLLVQAYRNLEALPEETGHDVRSLLGWTVNQEELAAADPGLKDDWLVLASRTVEEPRTGLRTQTNWLWGKQTRRPAQILNFAHRAQPLDASLAPGLALRGELVFFPGAYPLRAVFKESEIARSAFSPCGYPSLAAFLEEFSTALGRNPWLEDFPVVLENVTPIQLDQNWLLGDPQQQAVPLSHSFYSPWELFALSGGSALTVFGTWDGFFLTPMAAWEGERYVGL